MAQEYIVQIEARGKWKSAYRGTDKAEVDGTFQSSVAEFGSDAVRILKSDGAKEDGSINWVTAKTPVNIETQPEPEPAPEPGQDNTPHQPIKAASSDSLKSASATATQPSTFSVSESYKQSFDLIRLLFVSLWKLLKAWLGTPKKAILFFVTAGIWAIPSTVRSMKDGELTKKELWLGLLGYFAVFFTFGIGLVLIWCGNALWLFFRQFQGKQLSPRQFGLASALPALILYGVFLGETTYIALLSPAEKHEYLVSREFNISRDEAKAFISVIDQIEEQNDGADILSNARLLREWGAGMDGWDSLSATLKIVIRGETVAGFLGKYKPYLGDWGTSCRAKGNFTRFMVDAEGRVKETSLSDGRLSDEQSRTDTTTVDYRPVGTGEPAEALPGIVIYDKIGATTFVFKGDMMREWQTPEYQLQGFAVQVRDGVTYARGLGSKQTAWRTRCS